MVFSIVFYFLLPIGAAYFQDSTRSRCGAPVNVGLLFALSEFMVAWGIAFIYSRRANSEFDAMASELIRDADRRSGGQPSEARVICAALVVGCGGCCGTSRHRPLAQGAVADKWRWLTFVVFGVIIAVHDVRYVPCRQAREERSRLLHGGRRRVRPAERLGDRRRLSVGGVVSRHRGADLALRLRRFHVLGRLARRVHHRAARDRGAVPQHRQVHAGRYPRLSEQSARDARSSARFRSSPCRRST